MHPIVTHSSIHYGRVYNEDSQVIGNSAYISIFLKTPVSGPRGGYYQDQIEYNVYATDHLGYENGDSHMHLAFTVYSLIVPSDISYSEAVKSLLGESDELYLLSPDYGESVIAEQLSAGEITEYDAEVLRQKNWEERLSRDIAGSVVVRIVEAIEGVVPAV